MRHQKIFRFSISVILFLIVLLGTQLGARDDVKGVSIKEIEGKIQTLMEDGDIPGFNLVIVREDQPDVIKGFGYADVDKKTRSLTKFCLSFVPPVRPLPH